MSFLTHLYFNAMANPYDTLWTVIGFAGQGVFGVRMLIQWLSSESTATASFPSPSGIAAWRAA